MPSEGIIIDLRSAATKLSGTEVGSWANEQRVFISSAMEELEAERASVAAAVKIFGSEPVWFEQFGARDADAENAYLSEVDEPRLIRKDGSSSEGVVRAKLQPRRLDSMGLLGSG